MIRPDDIATKIANERAATLVIELQEVGIETNEETWKVIRDHLWSAVKDAQKEKPDENWILAQSLRLLAMFEFFDKQPNSKALLLRAADVLEGKDATSKETETKEKGSGNVV